MIRFKPVQYTKGDRMYMFMLPKIVAFILLGDSVSLADLDAARCHVVSYLVGSTTW